MRQVYATGRRKSSTARVFLRSSDNGCQMTVNRRKLEDYFPRATARIKIFQPLELTGETRNWNALITVKGGGTTGQAEAIRHGIALALRRANLELGAILRKNGLLTRDSRVVERKKVGLHKARRATQFSKR